MRRLAAAAIPLILITLLAGCVAGPGATGATTPPTVGPSVPPTGSPSASATLPTDPDTLVLQVRFEGGFVAPDYRFTAMPTVSIYADGRLIAPGAQIQIYPGPLLPAVLVTTLPAGTVERLLDDARAAGLAGGADAAYPPHGVADAPDTVFVVWTSTGATTTSFGALGMDQQDVPAAEQAARTAASAFAAKLSDPAIVGGATSIAYAPTAARIIVRDYAATPDPQLTQRPVAWPLATPLATFGAVVVEGSPETGRCGIVGGADLATLWPVLADANALTPFTGGGREYQLVVRPLLPHEAATCA